MSSNLISSELMSQIVSLIGEESTTFSLEVNPNTKTGVITLSLTAIITNVDQELVDKVNAQKDKEELPIN
jgi:hypothetical protein